MCDLTQPDCVTAVGTLGLLAVALVTFAQSLLYLSQLHASHARSIEPHLLWQDPRGQIDWGSSAMRARYSVVVTNFGRGSARVTSYECVTNLGENLEVRDLRVPATLPPGAAYTWEFTIFDLVEKHIEQLKDVTFRIFYQDIEARRQYMTFAKFVAEGEELHDLRRFVEVDERPAARRRVVKKPLWRLRS